ncbi:hypothetical protein PIB30_108070 [Stylosanthes scabra]|uniref:Uncharacterized protein n=1 Tax=Stylosanthes scabra TaxID=79078 RepID=A0ABU6W0M7_9FABA|nr:hypothetical protein [Stylosanthes scabra]
MPRSMKTAPKRQRQSDDVVYMEPPSDPPLFQYFSRLDDLNNYIFNFSERKEISPRNKTQESWGPHVKRQAFEMFNIQRIHKKKILCNVFNLEMRLLHYLITYVLFPRSTGHAHVQVDDLVIMWAMNNDIKIHWPYFIAHHMLRFTKSDHSKGIGYVCLWTRIFKHLGIGFSNESGRMLAQQHVIDTRALNHMGRNIQREEEEQAPPPQAQEPQEDQAGPSKQPSMRDMMQVLLRIEQNQANMHCMFKVLMNDNHRRT